LVGVRRNPVRLLLLLLFLAACWPAGAAAAEVPTKPWFLRPRQQPLVPRFQEPAWQKWVRNPIDAFILERLVKAGLEPAREADRTTLIRRVTFDLTGLPPSPEEIATFRDDPAPDAYEKLVDRLLASSHYGEHWGRHWLDVVRFAETEGFEYDRLRPGAWRYRDQVIKAFNDDKPFDRFVLEQLAGDEVDPGNHESQVLAGFHRLGPVRRNAGNKNVAMSRNEILTEMTDALGAVFLGLTLGCARCHDHKFDDITQKDYYRVQAFLAAAHEHNLVLASADAQKDWTAQTQKIQSQVQQLQKQLAKLKDEQKRPIQEKLAGLQLSLPEPLPTVSTVRNIAEERTPIYVLKRGDPEREGARVGPRPLSLFLPDDTPELPADIANPRTHLARWLTDPAHPLTARVWVNRVWHYHFGRGLVATPNDFGANGAPPTHPELLDFLAETHLRSGQRLKPLHRLILLSSTYRQSSTSANPTAERRLDPENRLLGRFPRRRLAAEEIRDAILATSGRLNGKQGGPSVVVPVEADLVQLLYDPSQWKVTPEEKEHDRRSVYLIARRNLQLPFFQAFDQPDAQVSCPRREASTHPLQALELLNGKLSNRLAETFASRLERECGDNHPKQVERAFWLTAGRPPTDQEKEIALAFLRRQPLKEFCLALFNLNAFLYVD